MEIQELYIVTKHFKAGGVHYFVGQVLTWEEVQQVRLYRIRLNEGKIVSLNMPNDKIKGLLSYLSGRWGVDAVQNVKDKVAKGSVVAEPVVTTPHPGTKKAAPKATPKPVPKVTKSPKKSGD